VKGWQSRSSYPGMIAAPAPLLGLASREQGRRGLGEDVEGSNRMKGRRSTYSSLAMTVALAPLPGLASREQVRRGRGQDLGGPTG
jgi:hypothetical protein